MLEGHNISILRGETLLIADLSFKVRQGETLVIKGANGSGKSTLLRALAGFIPLSQGTLKGNAQEDILYLGHKGGFHPEATVKDQITLWQSFHRIPAKKILEALELWGLFPSLNKKISHLSEGQRKRVSLSRCTWLPRCLWLLDEPHSAVDREGRELLKKTLGNHQGLLVLATHEPFKGSQEIHL